MFFYQGYVLLGGIIKFLVLILTTFILAVEIKSELAFRVMINA